MSLTSKKATTKTFISDYGASYDISSLDSLYTAISILRARMHTARPRQIAQLESDLDQLLDYYLDNFVPTGGA